MRRVFMRLVVCGALSTGCDLFPNDDGRGTGGGTGGSQGGGAGGGGGGTTDGGASDGGTGDGGISGGGTIAELVARNADMSTLRAALDKAGLTSAFSETTNEWTLFAPTNAAFEQLFTQLGLTDGLEGLTAEQLQPILRYHVLSSSVPTAAAVTAAISNTRIDSRGGRIQLSLEGTTIRLDGRASVTSPGVEASNGVVHVIDQVLLPSLRDISSTTPSMTNFFAAAESADADEPSLALDARLDDDAAPKVTVLVPSNEAFSLLTATLRGTDEGKATGITALDSFRPDQLTPVLRYHVLTTQVLLSGLPETGAVDSLGGEVRMTKAATVTFDGASVITADLYASNGVIHVISRVLLPSITDVVTTEPRLSLLKERLLAADADMSTAPKLARALDSTSPFTLFAPSNEAFAALGAGPSGQALTDLLLFHVVPGDAFYAGAALELTAPRSVPSGLPDRPLVVSSGGMPRRVAVSDGTNTATVTVTNLFTSNGVIHLLDRVLIPAR